MNLGTLAASVGQRLGVNTSSGSTRDGAAVRQFLTMRHNQLWKAFLWKDSVIEMALNLTTPYTPLGNYMPTKNRIILPPIFQNVLGVRIGWRSLDVQRPMLFYRANYAAFFQFGVALQYELLPSCVWEFDAVQNLNVFNVNVSDSNLPITFDELQGDGVTIQRNVYNTTLNGTAMQSTDRIDNFIKPLTQGTVGFGLPPVPTDTTTSIGNPLPPPNGPYFLNVASGGSAFQPSGQTIMVLSQGFQATFLITGNIGGGAPLELTFLAAVGDSPQGTAFPAPGAPVYLVPLFSTTNNIVTLTSNQTEASKSQRIQLVGAPSTGQSKWPCHILGRAYPRPYVNDSDVPAVDGFSEILFNLAYYDFKCRDDMGGSSDAQMALNEAVGPSFLNPPPGQQGKPGGWLGKLIELETIQAAYNTRIIPEQGFGRDDDYYHFPDKFNPTGFC